MASRLLIDCGMYQGKRAETYARNQNFPVRSARGGCGGSDPRAYRSQREPAQPGAKMATEGRIYATPATCDLADLMLRDSGAYPGIGCGVCE